METVATVRRGIEYFLSEHLDNKAVTVVQVGPFNEAGRAQEINRFLGTEIEDMNLINSYLLVHQGGVMDLEALTTGTPFADPVIHRAAINGSLAFELGLDYNHVLQSMLNPGTSDSPGRIALEQALLKLGYEIATGDQGFVSAEHFLRGDLTSSQLEDVSQFLANPDLNERLIIPREEYEKGRKVQVPVVTLEHEVKVEKYDIINMTDEELVELSFTRRLAASLEEMHQMQDLYRNPKFLAKREEVGLDHRATDVELEVRFGLRSEHCFHKEFNAKITLEDVVDDPVFKAAFEKGWLTKTADGNYYLEKGIFKTFIQEPAFGINEKLEKRGKNWIASMFEDNSGVVLYDEDFMFCIKFETHNSPSNKEPIQGAKTGIDGVNRDIFGTGRGTFDAIANFFHYCTGDPGYEGWLPQGVKHPYVLLKGATQGVREGGNESQIPTVGGGLTFDPRYIAKCLIYCGTDGWSRVKSPDGTSYLESVAQVGDDIYVVGHAVGVDGVHGATESSLSASKHISLGHVQADDSYVQRKMAGFMLEAARDLLFTDVTDCGAMGIASAYELSRQTGGIKMDLAKHPKKYAGIQPWQITCSETQDRMVVAARPTAKEELQRRAKQHETEVTRLGELTDSGYINLEYEGNTVALLDIEELFDQEPRKEMHATWNHDTNVSLERSNNTYSLEESLSMVMSQPDVASKEWFFRQKDSSVKGATILSPLVGLKQEVEADATVQKPLDTQGRDNGAIAYALGISPKQSDIDPYHSAQNSIIDMVGKIIAVGGALPDMENAKWDAWGVCGNYCQPNSESRTTLVPESGEHNLASLLREGIGVREILEELNIPLISGKDSMKCSCVYEVDEAFNLEDVPADLRRHVTLVDKDDGGRAIEIHDPDSYLASCAVKIEDYRKCVNTAFKQDGDIIYVVGTTKNELGASQYTQAVGYAEQSRPLEGGNVPKADLEEFVNVAGAIHSVIDDELVASCSYIHQGGIGAALAKAAMAGEKGASVDLLDIPDDNDFTDPKKVMYSETPGRFIVTIAPSDVERFEEIMDEYNANFGRIGSVNSDNALSIGMKATTPEVISMSKLKEAYQQPLRFDLDRGVA